MTDYRALLASIDLPQKSRRGSLEPVLAMIDALPRGRALDVPSGPGLMTAALDRLGFTVTGADIDASQFGLHGTVPFRQLDLDEALPFEAAAFDLVHCGDGIEHLENPFALFREFARILAPGGTLVLATPNYLNMERRVRFLLTGSLTKPLARPAGPAEAKADRGHINPLTLNRLGYMAEGAGLRLEAARTLLPRRGQRLLAPLAVFVWVYGKLLPAEQRRNLFAERTGSLAMLLGGKKLVAVFRKPG